MDQREVIEMIKTQIIDMIYTGDKREETVNLLPHIIERETCIVTMDGLNEWVDRSNKCVIPLLAHWHSNCVSVITSRPWKMADERIKDSEINNLIEIEGMIDSEELANKIIPSLQTGNVKTPAQFMKYVNERELGNWLTSPWLQTLLVHLWINKMAFSGSLCEINCILLDILFKSAHAKKGYFQRVNYFQCLSNTRFIQRQIDIFDALANAAFQFTFSSSKSLVLTERELLIYMSEDQLEFCLHAGVLTKRYSSNEARQEAQFSFIHETVQEFMAAYHIAHSKQDVITQLQTKSKCNVLQMSQTIIYLCGLDCKKANKLINCLVDDEFLKDISHGQNSYINLVYNKQHLLEFQEDSFSVLKFKHHQMDYDARCFALSVLFQRMIIAGCIEAKASGEKEICLNCTYFVFNTNLNESDSKALKQLLLFNNLNVRSLILERTFLQINEILTVLPSLSQLTYLRIEDTRFLQDIALPETIQHIHLSKCEFSSEWLFSLLITLSTLDHPVRCDLWDVLLRSSEGTRREESCSYVLDLLSEKLSHDMSNILISVYHVSKELFEILRDTSIGKLDLSTADCALLASEILHTLKRLTKLFLRGAYTGRFDLKLPSSLECLSLQQGNCSANWLCSLLITLSSLDHPVECHLLDFVLWLSEATFGYLRRSIGWVSELRFEIRSHDLSNIKIFVNNGSKELFEILRDSSIGNLYLMTADCASLASEILHTLNRLTRLYFGGTYTGRCDLKLPASLEYLNLQKVECSSEWLCSLLITLSLFDHPFTCELLNVVLQSSDGTRGDESLTHVPELQSEIVSQDLSNIAILVINASNELCELFCDTSIGSLNVYDDDYRSLEAVMQTKLSMLKEIHLRGTYLTRFDYDLPQSLECIRCFEGKCSLECLYSVLIKLSTIQHHVRLDVGSCFLITSNETCSTSLNDYEMQSESEYSTNVVNDRSNTNVFDLQSEMLSCDMSNIELRILKFNKERFEMLRGTNIKSVELKAVDDVSLTFVTKNTLPAFKVIRLQGTYLTGFNHTLPQTLQYMILEEGSCSSDWLYSLLIQLSTLGHAVRVCLIKYVVLQRRESIDKDPTPLMRGADLSNVKMEVYKDCPGLYETVPTMHITSLNMTKIEHAKLLSQTLPLLTHLQQLRICLKEYDTEMKLPECIEYVFIIYKTLSPSSLQHFVHNMSTTKHRVQCKLLFRVAENEDEYTRLKHDFCELNSVNVQHFEVVDKQGTVRSAAALTLSATADDGDDEYDKHLLRREGIVDSKPWIRYCKIRLNILYADACGESS